jgi:hypothetical protein
MLVYITAELVYPSKMRAPACLARVTVQGRAHAGAVATLLALLASCSGGSGTPPPPPPPDAGASERLIAFDREGELYTIDPGTGVDTLRLDTSMGGQDIGVVSSALYVSDAGRIWLGMGGAGGTLCPSCVMSLDASSGEVTMLATTTMKGVASMARSPAGGYIYAANGNSQELWGINPADGAPQPIANFSQGTARGGGMAFDQAGRLYAALDISLFTVDPGTAVTTQVGTFTYGGFPVAITDGAINSMAVLGGTLYGIVYDRQSTDRTTYLARIDPATAAVTYVNQNSRSMEGLAAVPANLLP